MPTMKPRIAVTLSQPVYETITRMAQLQGRSRGAVVNDLLEAVHPPMMRTVALLEAALEAPSQLSGGLLRTLEDIERQLSAAAGSTLQQLDFLLGCDATEEAAQAPAQRGPGRSSKGKSNPRIVTRGSGTKNQRLTKGSKQVRKGGKHGSV